MGDLSLFFLPLPCLASSFFCQIFILLNASMPCLWNTPVGELIQKQGANECIDQKAKEVWPEVAACLEVNLGDFSLFFLPLPCLASSFFYQIFMLLNALMPCLQNTLVGELIQKQGANECIDQKAKKAYGLEVVGMLGGESGLTNKVKNRFRCGRGCAHGCR